MTIGVDGNEANVKERVGVSIYTLNILRYFHKKARKELQFKIFLKKTPLAELPSPSKFFQYQIVSGQYLWSQIFLPLALFQNRDINVFFSPAHYIPRFSPVPTVVTIHDLSYLYYPEDFLKKDLFQLKNWTNYSLNKATKIIAVSKTTKKDIIKNYAVNDDKISVIYNGFEKSFQKLKIENLKFNENCKLKIENFILFVGTIQPRKNLSVLIEAFDKFLQTNKDSKLVIVGKKGWLYEKIFQKVQDMDLDKKIVFTDYLSNEQLAWLYKNAFCFVMPSLYEGFGIPVLEAMSFGCPVIASFASSLPEVAGDASLYFDPKNSDDLVEKLKLIKEDKQLVKDLVNKGKKRVKEFSWEKCGEKTLEILKNYASSSI